MCKTLGIDWKCGHQWRARLVCDLGSQTGNVRYACDPEQVRLNNEVHLIYRVNWCCSPQCCNEIEIIPRNERLAQIEARIDEFGPTRLLTDQAKRAEKASLHSVKNNVMKVGFGPHLAKCIPAFKRGLWMTNAMRQDMNQQQVTDVDPAFKAGYVKNWQGHTFDVPNLLRELRASRDAGTTIQYSNVRGEIFSSADTFETIRKLIHDHKNSPYERRAGQAVILDDPFYSQSGGRAYAQIAPAQALPDSDPFVSAPLHTQSLVPPALVPRATAAPTLTPIQRFRVDPTYVPTLQELEDMPEEDLTEVMERSLEAVHRWHA